LRPGAQSKACLVSLQKDCGRPIGASEGEAVELSLAEMGCPWKGDFDPNVFCRLLSVPADHFDAVYQMLVEDLRHREYLWRNIFTEKDPRLVCELYQEISLPKAATAIFLGMGI
jgi:hypothetical protein